MVSKPKDLKEGCLQTLRYFGIFRYPLTLQEIHRFNSFPANLEEIRDALNDLIREKDVFQAGHYYLAENKPEWVNIRIAGNERAIHLLERSGKYTAIIASFPFVKGIAISGSLSKFYAAENPDIDYFIIIATDRLWIARTLLHLFKKLTFLTGHQHYFCMNYFVDEKALKITHPNLYSSIEVATLLPVYNAPVMQHFFDENAWIKEFLPNHSAPMNMRYLARYRKQRLKSLIERIIGWLSPEKMNRSLMKITDRKWRRKWGRKGYPETDYDHAFLTNQHISKNHPVDYEKKVLQSLSRYKNQNQQDA